MNFCTQNVALVGISCQTEVGKFVPSTELTLVLQQKVVRNNFGELVVQTEQTEQPW